MNYICCILAHVFQTDQFLTVINHTFTHCKCFIERPLASLNFCKNGRRFVNLTNNIICINHILISVVRNKQKYCSYTLH